MPLRTVAVLILLLGMELCAGFSVALGSSLLDFTEPGMALFWLMGLCALGGTAIGLASAALSPNTRWHRIVLTLSAVVGAGIPSWLVSSNLASGLPTLILLTAAYARGVQLSQEPPSYDDVRSRFGLGFGTYFLGIVLVVARGVIFQSSVWHVLVLIGVTYVVVSLIALAFARFERMREPGAGLAVLLAVGLQLGILLVLALGVLQLLQFNLFGNAYVATRPVWDTVGGSGYRVLVLLAEPVQWVVNALQPGPPHAAGGLKPRPINLVQDTHMKHLKSQTPHYLDVTWVAVAILLAMLSGILWGVWQAIVRIPHHRPTRGYRERRRFTLSLSQILGGVVALWRNGLRRSAVTAEHVVTAARRRVQGDWPADPARRVYLQVLRKAAQAGLPKPLAVTPLEFQFALARRWPGGEGHFEAITEAYMERRYHEVELPLPYVVQLRRHGVGALEAIASGHNEAVVPMPLADTTVSTAGTLAEFDRKETVTDGTSSGAGVKRATRLVAVLVLPIGIVVGLVQLVHMIAGLYH